MPIAPCCRFLALAGSCISVTQPLYRSCTVITGTPTNLSMLLNSGKRRHGCGIIFLAPGTSKAPTYASARTIYGVQGCMHTVTRIVHECFVHMFMNVLYTWMHCQHAQWAVQTCHFQFPLRPSTPRNRRTSSLPARVIRRPVTTGTPSLPSSYITSRQPVRRWMRPPLASM